MAYPILRVHVDVIERNARAVAAKCAEHGMTVWGVTKGISSPAEIARRLKGTGITALGDSRMANIKRLKAAGVDMPFALVRIPMRSELEDVIEYADYSLVSDIGTLSEMSALCEAKKKTHKTLLMADLGDLREGFWPDEAEKVACELKNLSPALQIAGVGVNFGCASGVLPSFENLSRLLLFGKTVEDALGIKLGIYSGGATTRSLEGMDAELFPPGINNLRIGEGYLLGTDKSCGVDIKWLEQDTMELEAEVIEVRVKPSFPIGEVGRDAFGNIPHFEDRGLRLRGILGVGKQDVYVGSLKPLDEGVQIITASSDHMIVDLEDCPVKPKVGDILKFRPEYAAMLSLSTSPYVTKIYEG